MRFMALDVGERRVGIAVSQNGLLAAPHSILHRQSKKEDFVRLQRLIDELQIERIIVGMPYSLAGDEQMGPQALRIKRYADALAKVVDTPLTFFDESYSTVDAEAYLTAPSFEEGRRKPGKRGKTPLDAAAAAVILQKYLDSQWKSKK
jgi:putative Holliday junction resolvase